MNTRSILRGLTLGLALLALPTAALAADGFARSSGTLRAGAGTDYPAIMRVARGSSLDIIGCITRYSWCDVAVAGERGWFPGRNIGILRDGRRVYLSDGGAMLGLTILTFGMADYWGTHYSGRPWYNDRRYWRRHGPLPPHLIRPPRPGAQSPVIPPRANATVKPGDRAVAPPKARAPRAVAKPIKRAPRKVIRANPQRNPGVNRTQRRPMPQQRTQPRGGQRQILPAGR